jgi:hypothetical protein
MSSAPSGVVSALPPPLLGTRTVPTVGRPPVADTPSSAKGAASTDAAKAPASPRIATTAPVAVETNIPSARTTWRQIFEYRYAPTLVSLIVHCLVVLVLGLVTVAVSNSSGTFLTGVFSPDDTVLSAPVLTADEPSKTAEPGGSPGGFESSVSDAIAAMNLPIATDGTYAIGDADFSASLGSGGGIGGGDLPELGASKGASFFGLTSKGTRFVFVIDSSISMWGPRWIDVRKELIRSVRKLEKGQYFFVICFDTGAIAMYGDDGIAQDFAPAEEEHFRKLEAWLQEHTLGPGTRATTSLVQALKLKPDAIFLLTDGEFQDNVLQTLRTNNRNKAKKRKIPVNTIGFHSQLGAPLLSQIATENYGQFRYVAPPVNMPIVPMMRFQKGARIYPPQSIEQMMAAPRL